MNSIAYYDEHAKVFFQDTIELNMEALRTRFLQYLTPGSRILDVGCGSGRDSLAFIKAGFVVSAFDGSAELALLASKVTGVNVRHMAFSDVMWIAEFDAVWACASLLHVPRSELPKMVRRILQTLVSTGVIYMSFKLGDGERQIGGRHFTDMNEASLSTLAVES